MIYHLTILSQFSFHNAENRILNRKYTFNWVTTKACKNPYYINYISLQYWIVTEHIKCRPSRYKLPLQLELYQVNYSTQTKILLTYKIRIQK